MTLDWVAFVAALGVCLAVGLLEWLLTGDELKTWYPLLRKPWWHLPLWLFVAVAVGVYLLDGFLVYRLLTRVTAEGRVVAVSALVVVMVLNALWNYAVFHYRSTLIGLLGLAGFLGPLLVLQVALFAYDEVAARGPHGVLRVRGRLRRPAVLHGRCRWDDPPRHARRPAFGRTPP